MSILRLIVAWLVMAALPLQGIAAASMLFCDQAAHSTARQQPAHDHASHDHHHAAPGHGGQDGASGHGHQAVAGQSGHGVDLAQAGHEGGVEAASIGDDHACPICASCCNLVALSEAPRLSLDPARPAPPRVQGPSRILTREAPAPDKPPRA